MRLSLVILTLLVSGCATPTVIQSTKPGDMGWSFAQLQNEYSDADRIMK